MYLAYDMEQRIILAWIRLRICRNMSLWHEVLYWRRFLCRRHNFFVYLFITYQLDINKTRRAVQTQTERSTISSASSMDRTPTYVSPKQGEFPWCPRLPPELNV